MSPQIRSASSSEETSEPVWPGVWPGSGIATILGSTSPPCVDQYERGLSMNQKAVNGDFRGRAAKGGALMQVLGLRTVDTVHPIKRAQKDAVVDCGYPHCTETLVIDSWILPRSEQVRHRR